MGKVSKNRIYLIFIYIGVYIAVFISGHYINGYRNSYKQLKDRMYYDFKNFGSSLEEFGSSISEILVLNNYSFDDEKEFINTAYVRNFRWADYDASDLGRKPLYGDYYDYVYLGANGVIKNILKDGKLSAKERKYLETFYNYNEELIEEYKNVLGELYYKKWDYEKQKELKKRIVDIYNQYSAKADDLLNSPKYSLLKGYKGDFEDVDFGKVKAYCEEVFSMIVKDQTLKYDNRDEINAKEYIFRTYFERDIGSPSFDDVVDYRVEYDKNTKEVTVSAVSYGISSRDYRYKENELDNMVDELVKEFNDNVFNYEKKITYDEENNIEDIRYSYIEKINDVYDEMKKIDVTIEPHGLISNFRIMYPYNNEIALPKISENNILKKINEEGEVQDIFMVRNIEGDVEYEIHLKYDDTIYAAVFNGDDAAIKYYGKKIRNYNSNIK